MQSDNKPSTINTTKVYVPVRVEDELPDKEGYYPVCSENVTSKNRSTDEVRFRDKAFLEIPNWDHVYWLKEETDKYLLSKSELDKIINDSFEKVAIFISSNYKYVGNGLWEENRKDFKTPEWLTTKQVIEKFNTTP